VRASQEERTSDVGQLPLLRAHLASKPAGKIRPSDIECAAPDCHRIISYEASQRTRFCGPCQLRARELRTLVPGHELSDKEIDLLWDENGKYRVSEAAAFLGIKQRSLYSLIARDAVQASTHDEAITIARDDLLDYARSIRGVLGLKDAADEMSVDYGYLRELVRRGAINPDRTFWGHYGIARSRLDRVKALIERALPRPDDYNLVSFSNALGVHHSVIQRMIKSGLVGYRKGVTGRISIPKSELRRLRVKAKNQPDSVPRKVRMRLAQ